jgi:hypothetical protein
MPEREVSAIRWNVARRGDKLRDLIKARGFTIANLPTRLIGEGKIVEYRMVIRSRDRANQLLSQHLVEFRISPTGD